MSMDAANTTLLIRTTLRTGLAWSDRVATSGSATRTTGNADDDSSAHHHPTPRRSAASEGLEAHAFGPRNAQFPNKVGELCTSEFHSDGCHSSVTSIKIDIIRYNVYYSRR
jgi:hypothetical protein